MRFKIFFLGIFFCMHAHAAFAVRSSLNGHVLDSMSQPLPGAAIEIPDLHTGTVADINGYYVIDNLPSGRFLIIVKMLGFASRSVIVNLNGATTQDFVLAEAVLEQHEVIVTGASAATERRRSPTPIQIIGALQMRQNVSSNIIDAITRMPGVQQMSTGPAISKPVIRGLGYNRIVTLSDGVRQEGQQWGDEHGIEIDDQNVSRVEVLKGPASLSYGSDAIGGVINILSEDPAPAGNIKMDLSTGFQTNSGLAAFHGRVAGNEKGINWSAFYTGKASHDYKNANDGYVFNSRFYNNNFGGSLGIRKHWGSSSLSYTSFNQQLGLVEGTRDSATGSFIKPVAINGTAETQVVGSEENQSYSPQIPRQQITHQKLTWISQKYLPGSARLGLSIGLQQNDRREFDDILQPDEPGLNLRLRTLNYHLHYLHSDWGAWQLNIGCNGMFQKNENRGVEFLIPDYRLFDIGGYVIAKKEIGKWTFSGGLRADTRKISVDALYVDSAGNRVENPMVNGAVRFKEFERTFSSPSGSLGASWLLNKRTAFKANFSSGYRAPNIAELAANGVHEGTIRYEYGYSELKPENSFQGDLGFEYTSEHLALNASVFYNHIRNFIFTRKLNGINGADSIPVENNEEAFAAFQYQATHANLFGGELYLDFHPHPFDWLHFENTFSYVQGRNQGGADSTFYLPAIPAARWLSGLRAQTQKQGKSIANAYLKIELDHFFAQNQVFSAYNTETPSVAYSLVNASLGFDIVRRKQTVLSVVVAGQNLGDVTYQNHLSRLRFADTNYVTGRNGIFGMGRNISFQVFIPLNIKTPTGTPLL